MSGRRRHLLAGRGVLHARRGLLGGNLANRHLTGRRFTATAPRRPRHGTGHEEQTPTPRHAASSGARPGAFRGRPCRALGSKASGRR
ncbi:hypothetical protein A176_005693 [Myxococcus hansupus]|uniref:Uncharacterized protein n=1 Tax=Pseudomyxococcus hansupus TaxID=1297742 RepID=A0A0H4WZB0_9BACT|nr:hypothetical protein A176_005693 [Myxococcus hansupus]